MTDSAFEISLEWATDAKGFRFERNLEEPDKAPFVLELGNRIVRNGGQLRRLRPAKIHGLLETFARIETPSALLSFMNKFGPLTRHGMSSSVGETLVDADGKTSFALPEGEDLNGMLDEAAWFRRLLLLKNKPEQIAREIERSPDTYRMRAIPDKRRGIRLVFFPDDLLDLLRLQLVQGLLGPASHAMCPLCSELFKRGAGTERRGDAQFCCDQHRIDFNSHRRTSGVKIKRPS